jgi:hypothetical protein
MNSSSCLSEEKINISETPPIAIHNKIFFLEKGLKQNSFNPLKDSPPNNFLLNLNKRYNKYYHSESVVCKNDHAEIK